MIPKFLKLVCDLLSSNNQVIFLTRCTFQYALMIGGSINISFNTLGCKSYMTFSLIYPGLIPGLLVFSHAGHLLALLLRAFTKLMFSRHLKSFCYCKLYWRLVSAIKAFQLILVEFLAENFLNLFLRYLSLVDIVQHPSELLTGCKMLQYPAVSCIILLIVPVAAFLGDKAFALV